MKIMINLIIAEGQGEQTDDTQCQRRTVAGKEQELCLPKWLNDRVGALRQLAFKS